MAIVTLERQEVHEKIARLRALREATAAAMTYSGRLDLIGQVRKRIQQVEVEIVAQNEIIARLELTGDDARKARAIRAQLWLSEEADLAEIERLEEMNRQEAQG